jgi:hypothetical protein
MENAGQAIQQQICLKNQQPIQANAGVFCPTIQSVTTKQKQNAQELQHITMFMNFILLVVKVSASF